MPFDLNCRAARVLAGLAKRTGLKDLFDHAATALAYQTKSLRSRGVEAVIYALALGDIGRMSAS